MADIHKVAQRQIELAKEWILAYVQRIKTWRLKRSDMVCHQDKNLQAGLHAAQQMIQLLRKLEDQYRYVRPLHDHEVTAILKEVQQQLQQFDSDYRENSNYNLAAVAIEFTIAKVTEIAAVVADGLRHLASRLPNDEQDRAQQWKKAADQ